jgi:putative spermidine/putrescine transport system substrate-binding protein
MIRARALLTSKLLAVLVALCAGSGLADAQAPAPSTLTVASFGGGLDAVYKKIFEPFEKQYNVTIRWIPSSAAENLAKIKATRAKPEYDVAMLENFLLYSGAKEDLFEPVNETIVTNYKNLYPQARPVGNVGAPIGFLYQGIFYRPDEFAKMGWAPPTSWNDIFRPEFCGHLGILHPNVSDGMRTLLIFAGGDTKRVPEAIASLGKLKSCVPVLEPSSPKLEEKVQLGEYSVGVINSIRAIPLIQRRYPIKFVLPKEGTMAGYSAAVAVKGAPNPKMAQEFMNWFLRPEAQQQLMAELFYSPTNRTVPVPKNLADMGVLSSEGMKTLMPVNDEDIFKQRAAWVRQAERAMTP